MYIPEHFKQDQWDSAKQLITQYSFAQIVTVQADSTLCISHVPVLYDEQSHQLLFHFAAPNEHNQELVSLKSTVVFSGPHGYISPNWAEQLLVPTWNYASVQITGCTTEVTEATQKFEFMGLMSNFYEQPLAEKWSISQLNDKQRKGMLNAIRCYHMSIDDWQAKLKLSQNRSKQAIEQVIENLKVQNYPYQDNHSIAGLMQQQIK
jgi:transcriptional regulator